jgi:hypothetical protein
MGSLRMARALHGRRMLRGIESSLTWIETCVEPGFGPTGLAIICERYYEQDTLNFSYRLERYKGELV